MSEILYLIFPYPLLAASIGGLVYYLLVIRATRKLYRARATATPNSSSSPAISLLKPLRGADPELELHLESFFQQDYPSFEILFAVREAADPATAVVERLIARYPQVPA